MSRAKVFSSRSSASSPATSSTVTNISVTSPATATANVSSGVSRPSTHVACRPHRLATAAEQLAGEVEVLDREAGELATTCASSLALGDPAAARRAPRRGSACERSQAEDVDVVGPRT